MSKTLHFDDDNFEQDVLKSDIPVLVDFWAEWCGPCRAVAPVIEELAEQYEGKIKIGKINVDENLGTTSAYDIRSIPTFIIFEGGNVKQSARGALSRGRMKEFIESSLDSVTSGRLT